MASDAAPVRICFLGCGHITDVHARHLKRIGGEVRLSYASRDWSRAQDCCRRHGGVRAYGDYDSAIADPRQDAVVVAVPPLLHLDLTLRSVRAGRHVLVEKPAFVRSADYPTVIAAGEEAGRVVMVAENDHYKPLASTLRGLLAEGVIGEMVFAQFTTVARRLKRADDWRNDETLAGGDAFFEEGIHWLHLAGSLGPKITRASGFRPAASADARQGDRRVKSMLVAFEYDNGATGALFYSREVPSLLRGARVSKLFGRQGVITFESNGAAVFARGRGLPRVIVPGLSDVRGYQAMYRDFVRAIRSGTSPQMDLHTAMADHRLMEEVYE